VSSDEPLIKLQTPIPQSLNDRITMAALMTHTLKRDFIADALAQACDEVKVPDLRPAKARRTREAA
jgi:hypothetical protein